MTTLQAIRFVISLAPEMRVAFMALLKAIKSLDERDIRESLEAARRVAFEARQR